MSQQEHQKPKNPPPIPRPKPIRSLSPVPVETVMDFQDIEELLKWCKALAVNTDNCACLEKYRERLLQHIKERYRVPPAAPAVSRFVVSGFTVV